MSSTVHNTSLALLASSALIPYICRGLLVYTQVTDIHRLPHSLLKPRSSHLDLTMAKDSDVPQPGPARLSKGAGPDEWLEEAKQCRYLPEADMKRLCEIVKECLMEGEDGDFKHEQQRVKAKAVPHQTTNAHK